MRELEKNYLWRPQADKSIKTMEFFKVSLIFIDKTKFLKLYKDVRKRNKAPTGYTRNVAVAVA